MKSRILSVDKPGSSGWRWGLGGLAITAIAAAIGYGYFDKPAVEPTVVRDHSNLGKIMALGSADAPAVWTPQASPALPTQPVVIPPALTKQQQFDLLKTGNVEQRYTAYKLLLGCIEPEAVWNFNQKHGSRKLPMPDSVKNCGDLNPGTLGDDAQRHQLLIPAVRAGKRDAYTQLMLWEGPQGGVALVVPGHVGMPEAEWNSLMAEGREAGLKTADPVVSEAKAFALADAKNPTQEQQALALETLVAGWSRRWETEDPKPDLKQGLKDSPLARRLIKSLPPDVAAKAIEAGKVPRPQEIKS